jgi:SOS response regulatory protein OraA/RecX
MAFVKYVRPSKDKGRISLGIDTGEELLALSVGQGAYSEAGEPEAGVLLSTDARDLLVKDDLTFRCMKKALSILSYGDNNRRTLYAKLCRGGFSGEISRSVTERCVSLGYVNEKRQLQRLCCVLANERLNGPSLIRKKLLAKGYRAPDIEEALDTLLEKKEIDFSESFRLLCKKKGYIEKGDIVSAAYKYGFSHEED